MSAFMLFLAASASPVAGAPLPDIELAKLRGGFALPGGLDISLVVQTDTKLDGTLLLRSVYRVTEGMPVLSIYAPAKDQEGAMIDPAHPQSAAPASQGNVQVMFDRQNGVSFISTPGTSTAVSLAASGTDGLGEAPAGTAALTPPTDGGAVAVPGGNLSVQSLPAGTRVRLEGDGLDITHLVGNALGSIIANTGSDRAIDTATTVGIDINGASPANLGSAMLRVEAIAIDSAIQMAPR